MSSSAVAPSNVSDVEAFGHPPSLYKLFFAELWERFSYYGMRALLMLYLTKSMLFGDQISSAIYGAYTALVYMTPFFGGMLADRLLGCRKAVTFGGLLMAIGQFTLMLSAMFFQAADETASRQWLLYVGLGFLIMGNGFFKPNISTMIGGLYPNNREKRDSGFTIFYMGINLGAAASPLLCGWVGETYGYHYGFMLAGIGMLLGVAIFISPSILSLGLILAAVVSSVVGLIYSSGGAGAFDIAMNIFTAIALLAAAGVAIRALPKGDVPDSVGRPPRTDIPLRTDWTIYGIAILLVPLMAMLACGFSVVRKDGQPWQLIDDDKATSISESVPESLRPLATMFIGEVAKPAGLILFVTGVAALAYIFMNMLRLQRIARHRLIVALVLTFFSMLFWAFFEQAGSSVSLFTDRNIDRVFATDTITEADVGKSIELQPSQEQVGYSNGGKMFTINALNELRDQNKDKFDFTIPWTVDKENVGMQYGDRAREVLTSKFQAVNAIFILIFGLIFSALWAFMAKRNLEPSTPVKFALGLIQLGLGFGAFWLGSTMADGRGMVAMSWLLLGYLLHTTGELCLSPVGLSMITKLSPKLLVSTMMGVWFLATAFSQYLGGIIAMLTGVEHGEQGAAAAAVEMIPKTTLPGYMSVFGAIAIASIASGVFCLMLSPLLKYLMHENVKTED
jgi:proton-dependent oligopeptide transporter, POT family